MKIRLPKIKVVQLNCGGTLIYEKTNFNQASSVRIGFSVGSAQNEINGTAHFIEHMYNHCTKKRDKETLVADIKKYFGTSYNAGTWRFATLITFTRVNSLLDQCFELASDMLINGDLDPKLMESERGVILEEYKRKLDLQKTSIGIDHENAMLEYIYSPQQTLGDEADLAKITPEVINNFKSKYYNKQNFIVSVAGSESLGKVKKYVEKHFAALPSGGECAPSTLQNIVKPSNMQVLEKELDTPLVYISLKCVGLNNPKHYTMGFLCEYLNGQNGKLFRLVRESGLAYSISASRCHFTESGSLDFSFKASKENVNKVIDKISIVVDDIMANGIPEDRIKQAKENFEYSFKESQTTNGREAVYNAVSYITKEPFTSQADIKAVLDMDKQTIDSYMRELFSKNTEVYVTIGGRGLIASDFYDLKTIKKMILKGNK